MEFESLSSHGWQSLDADKLSKDLKELRSESRYAYKMLKSHAKILLKAVEYWNLRYGEKYKQ